MPNGITFAELNGKLRSEDPFQQESLFIPWSRILLRPHDLIESFPEVLVPAQSFGCFFQLLNVFSFCMRVDEGLGLLHWNKSRTERSAPSSGTQTEDKASLEHTSHAINMTENLARDKLNIALKQLHCTVFRGGKCWWHGKMLSFFTAVYIEPDLTLQEATLSAWLDNVQVSLPT